MRTEQVILFKFEELSDDAKEKAREWYRQGALDYDWWEDVYSDASEVFRILGIDSRKGNKSPAIWFSGFSSQGDGACFEGTYSYAKGSVRAIKRYAPNDDELHRIASGLMMIQRRYGYSITASLNHTGRYHHEHSVEVDLDARSIVDPLDGSEIISWLRDLMRWIYRRLEEEHDWLLSDEQVDESIIANGYEFTEDGKVY